MKKICALFGTLMTLNGAVFAQAAPRQNLDPLESPIAVTKSSGESQQIYVGLLQPKEIVGISRKGWYTSDAEDVRQKIGSPLDTIHPVGYFENEKFFSLRLSNRSYAKRFERCATMKNRDAKDNCLLQASAFAFNSPDLANVTWHCNGNAATAFSGTVEDYRDNYESDDDARESYEGNVSDTIVNPVLITRNLSCGKVAGNPLGQGVVATDDKIKSYPFVRGKRDDLRIEACKNWLDYIKAGKFGKDVHVISRKKNAVNTFATVLRQACRPDATPHDFDTFVAPDPSQRQDYAFVRMTVVIQATDNDEGGVAIFGTWFRIAQSKIERIPAPVSRQSPNYLFAIKERLFLIAYADRDQLVLNDDIQVIEEVTDQGFKRIGYVTPSERSDITARQLSKLPYGLAK